MKRYITVLTFLLMILLLLRCNSNSDAVNRNNKDLEQSMQDMMVYHDNLGTELRKGRAGNASWLLEGMDSSLLVISANFNKHRKLTEPFEKTYRNKLQPAIKDIRKSLEVNNFPNAIKAYRILTNNCNSCHKDHDIDEKVLDLTNPDSH